jgi:hypothetical protein
MESQLSHETTELAPPHKLHGLVIPVDSSTKGVEVTEAVAILAILVLDEDSRRAKDK